MAAKKHGTNRAAFEVTYKASPQLASNQHAALVALCRTLADELDTEGGSRISAAYLSALKDVGRVLATPERKQGAAGSMTVKDEVGEKRSARGWRSA